MNLLPASVIAKLKATQKQPCTDQILVGFDGYVDYIQKVVKSATSERRIYFDTKTNVSTQIAAASGKSAQFELRTLATKMGGNAPIMSHALSNLGIRNYCMGMMGVPEVQEVFRQMNHGSELLSIGQPASTHALEFEDGKLLLSEVSSFDEIDLDFIIQSRGKHFVLDPLSSSKIVAMVDWSNLPKCTALWTDILALVRENSLTGKTFFFDLCDPSKKNNLEILEVLEVICNFSSVGSVILGLNENEALKIFQALSARRLPDGNSPPGRLRDISSLIFEQLNIDVLLVHPVDRTIVVTDQDTFELYGNVVSNPAILTGGGDNLNAGFCLGLLNGFSLKECMITAMGTSGAYVKSGISPSMDDLINYLSLWKTE
jgi:hypothetical protein